MRKPGCESRRGEIFLSIKKRERESKRTGERGGCVGRRTGGTGQSGEEGEKLAAYLHGWAGWLEDGAAERLPSGVPVADDSLLGSSDTS